MADSAPLRILIIDDDEHVQKSLVFVLKMMGHEIFTAETAAQGVQRFVECRPDLVFVDMVMPGGPGVDAVHEMRALDASVYIVAMSGSDEGGLNNLLAAARAKGANESLGKPFDFNAIERVLADVVALATPNSRTG
jgi:DNA-binding NtrC family response regulator